MPLVFLPDIERLFLWGEPAPPRELPSLPATGAAHRAILFTPEGRRQVDGVIFPLVETAAALSSAPTAELEALPASFATWTLASKLAMELVARERVVPTLVRLGDRVEGRWAAALSTADDARRAAAIAASMPPAAHAVPVASGDEHAVWAPDALLHGYLDAVADALLRMNVGGPEAARADTGGWDARFRKALSTGEREFEVRGFADRTVLDDVERWSAPALGARDRLRACFRLELPVAERAPFRLAFLLQSPDDPSLIVPAAEVWESGGAALEELGRAFRDPEESLLEALGRAARLFPPLRAALESATPESVSLDAHAAWAFLGEAAPALAEAGFGVIVPGELTAQGQRRLRLRMRVGGKGKAKVAGAVSGAAGLGLDELVAVNWEAVVGDEPLSPEELTALARQKAPLVRFRGAWVAIDPRELGAIQKRLAGGSSRATLREAMQAALAGEARDGELTVPVVASGALDTAIERLRTAAASDATPPESLQATLRPYQARGLNWLSTLASLGLGACLADDMGLGKTVQLLAFLARRMEQSPEDTRPALLVAPTSVIGNWEREALRFTPRLQVIGHYGGARARAPEDFEPGPGRLVLTSYGLLRRDAELLRAVDWSLVALDEAQNIKNAASSTARAARALRASHRFALTGTPVENRLAELWSVLEFANPGLLGALEAFRRKFAIPIERYGDDAAAERLRRMTSPFVLRRLKTDPAVVKDLPPKNEMKVVCTLTREQATLYKAVVDEELRRIAQAEGMERRGRVLALLAFTKQICNHPAQYLSEPGPLARRSGKLARITEMLEEAIAAGDKALVFTQFKEMGDRLVAHFRETLGVEIAFLHGGTSKSARDALVKRFQEDPRGPRVFVLSLKAGGTGLNLTAASHVFHYDRWWNPAVEDQATDRAYRIGQKRTVLVYKLLCSGTVEEKIDRLLEQKRKLAAKVVGTGESWITELDSGALHELFALSSVAAVATDDADEAAPPAPGGKRGRRSTAVPP